MFNFNFFPSATPPTKLVPTVVISFNSEVPRKYLSWLLARLNDDFFRQPTYKISAKVNQRFNGIIAEVIFDACDIEDATELEKSIRYIAPDLETDIILRSL